MNLTLIPAILLSRIINLLLTITKKGSGTALPGLIIEKCMPSTLGKLRSQLKTVIIITGTNGKTTVTKLLSTIIMQTHKSFLANHAGANLRRGILSELLKKTNWKGELNYEIGIFEVEEATLPKIAKLLAPNILILTNIYRDQLDAYGEIDALQNTLAKGIAECPDTTLIYNRDDPRLYNIIRSLKNQKISISIPPELAKNIPYEGEIELVDKIQPEGGNYLRATDIYIHPDLTINLSAEGIINKHQLSFKNLHIATSGFFHSYNILSAFCAAHLLGISENEILSGLESFKPPFGRGELITIGRQGKTVDFRLLLIKNPAGFSLNLAMLSNIKDLKLVLLINDNIADGRDISWLWDAKLETLNSCDFKWIICSGQRGQDMMVRLKYIFTNPDESLKKLEFVEKLEQVIDSVIDVSQDKDTIYVLPTYTAMLELRKLMGKNLNQIS